MDEKRTSASLFEDAHDEDSVIGQPGVRVPEMRKNQQYLGNNDEDLDDDRSSTEDLICIIFHSINSMGCCSISGDVYAEPIKVDDTIFDHLPHVGTPVSGPNSCIIRCGICVERCCSRVLRYDETSVVSGRQTFVSQAESMCNGLNASLADRIHEVRQSIIEVETAPGVTIKVFVSLPAISEQPTTAMLFAHSGGAVVNEAYAYIPLMNKFCLDMGCAVFNVDYRKGPECKAPGGQLDMVAVIKYVRAHATELNVDIERLALCGDSGGGWICSGAAYQLAKDGESHLVKLVFLRFAQLSHEIGRVPYGELNSYERPFLSLMTAFYKCLATDYESQTAVGDTALYPGLMTDSEAARMPPCVIMTSEFDWLNRDCIAFGEKLLRAGKLKDFYSHPGSWHGYMYDFGHDAANAQIGHEQFMKAWRKYV